MSTGGPWKTAHIPSDPRKGPGLDKPNAKGSGQPTSRLSEHRDVAAKPPRFFIGETASYRALNFSPRTFFGVDLA
jgi:hypothetical protein